MKNFLFCVTILVGVFGIATLAHADDEARCTLTTATGSSASTAAPTTGTCDWRPGAVVAMQCTTDTYYDPTATQGGTATSADFFVSFSTNPDVKYVELKATQKAIAVRAVSGAGTCVFGWTTRVRSK